jgi:glutamate-ammonia-ligase adenylyltransferase
MEAGALDIADAQVLISAARLEHGLTQVLRIALEGPFKPEAATRGLKTLLARVGDALDFTNLEAHLAENQKRVREVFVRLMGVTPERA